MENNNYRLGQGIASNPVTYALWQITDMIEDVTGGIALPTLSVMGNMVDLNTTVTNLMRAGIVGVSSLATIGSIISGVGNTINPSNMLASLGISRTAAKQTNRGSGLNRRLRSSGVSSSTLIGNTAADDYYAASTTVTWTSKTKKVCAKACTHRTNSVCPPGTTCNYYYTKEIDCPCASGYVEGTGDNEGKCVKKCSIISKSYSLRISLLNINNKKSL